MNETDVKFKKITFLSGNNNAIIQAINFFHTKCGVKVTYPFNLNVYVENAGVTYAFHKMGLTIAEEVCKIKEAIKIANETDTYVLIISNSPYVLSLINNLYLAKQAEKALQNNKKKLKKLDKIVPFIYRTDDVSAYFVSIDEKTKKLQWKNLENDEIEGIKLFDQLLLEEGAGSNINQEFDNIFNLLP